MTKLVSKNSCHISHRISKKTVIASYPEGSRTREWLESLTDEQWTITAFVPETRLVCATVTGAANIQTYLALTLPELITRNLTSSE